MLFINYIASRYLSFDVYAILCTEHRLPRKTKKYALPDCGGLHVTAAAGLLEGWRGCGSVTHMWACDRLTDQCGMRDCTHTRRRDVQHKCLHGPTSRPVERDMQGRQSNHYPRYQIHSHIHRTRVSASGRRVEQRAAHPWPAPAERQLQPYTSASPACQAGSWPCISCCSGR